MEGKTCLVTGGAGFIGCAISEELLKRFDRVIALDILHPQIHPERGRPGALPKGVELVIGDVADPSVWQRLFEQVRPTVIVHLAAETGTGQSLSEGSRHSHVNVTGTTTMLDALARIEHVPEQMLLASSRAVYGEGPWQPLGGGPTVYPGQRSRKQLACQEWEFRGFQFMFAEAATTVPYPVSIYAATKLAQEHILKAWGSAFGANVKILRLQNVYGPGQTLANPYTGIVSLFCRVARSGDSIPLYEDGKMLRDFVLIDDVAEAILCAVELDDAAGRTLDVGTGEARTIADIAQIIAQHYSAPAPHVCGKYRFGDVRHAACNIQPTVELLGWKPRYDVRAGIRKLASWIETQYPADQLSPT